MEMSYSPTVWQDHVVDGSGNVIQQGTPVSAKNLNNIEKGIFDAHAQFAAQAIQQFAATNGWNSLLTDQASPLNYVVYGRTLVNLLGKEGNFEDITSWVRQNFTLDSTHVKYGSYAFKASSTTGDTFAFKDFDGTDAAKFYVALVDVYITRMDPNPNTTTSPRLTIYDKGSYNNLLIAYSDPSKLNQWQTIALKFTGKQGVRVQVGRYAGNDNFDAWFDGARIFEVDSATYAKINVDPEYTGDKLAAKFPYIDGIKHLTNPGIMLPGKNLLPPFTDWTLHANAAVTEPYKLTLNATASYQNSGSPKINVMPGNTYVFSYASRSSGLLHSLTTYDANGNTVRNFLDNVSSITMQSNEVWLVVNIKNDTTTGTLSITNPQLELGSTATDFAPRNDDYAFVPVTMASSVDGSVRDTFDSRLGTVTRRWNTDVVLDGSLGWEFSTDFPGYKTVFTTAYKSELFSYLTKFNGVPLLEVSFSASLFTSTNTYNLSFQSLVIAISDTDSGWGETYNPSAAEIAAYFYGWKMNNGTFGTPYNGSGTKTWVPWNATSNSGAVTTVPTTPSTAITSGAYDYYRLSYQMASPITEQVVSEGALGLHIGGNQFELFAGVIVREKVTPSFNSGFYFINAGPESKLSARASRILSVHKGTERDTKWAIRTRDTADPVYPTYGAGFAQIPQANLDPNAEYTVTYQSLDRYALTANPVDMTALYNTNLKTIVDGLVQDMSDVKTTSSINARAVAELYKRVKALGG
jgi:hypothetical protein